MFASFNNRGRTGFIIGSTAAMIFAFSSGLRAQSPLTVQPSTGRVGVGNTNPAETLDVNGNIKNSGSLSVGTTAQTDAVNRFRHLNTMVGARRNTSQLGLSANVYTAIQFNATDDFDTDALHDTVTNNTRLTAAINGKYIVTGSSYIVSNNTNPLVGPIAVYMRILKNGGSIFGTTSSAYNLSGGGPGAALSTAAIISLNATDYVELQVYVSASSGTFDVNSAIPATFQMAYVGE